MGMGGASLGLADDFTALYWNPAGMAQIRKFELFSSFSHNMASTDTFFTGEEVTGTSRSRTRPNSIGFVYRSLPGREDLPSASAIIGHRTSIIKPRFRALTRVPELNSQGLLLMKPTRIRVA